MLAHRASGILLHPTSLPSHTGIGELGVEALRFVDFLEQAGQAYWQILPLGPTGFGDSPYSSFSSFAGNPLLISLQALNDEGLLSQSEILPPFSVATDRVDYGAVVHWKLPLLAQAATRFLASAPQARHQAFRQFCEAESDWLEDYAAFMAIKRVFEHQGAHGDWTTAWDRDIAQRTPAALAHWTERCAPQIAAEKVLQFFFFEQWHEVKRYANERSIAIIGDVPIFVALDSADVWASPKSFQLDSSGRPTHVAGVPPDYFSPTGQRWGNPLYDWNQMRSDGYRWWIRRIAGTRRMVDVIRIDHFRGFESNWSIPADQPTAVFGQWVPGPGLELFDTLRRELGELPIIAEDLGLITPEVEALRDAAHFPGMKVLQFAFHRTPGTSNAFLPHQHVPHGVVYTGTHDNDTTRGWFETLGPSERKAVLDYLGHKPDDIAWAFNRLAMASVARLAILPMQDILSLGSDARMNRPASDRGNWDWRMRRAVTTRDLASRLRDLVTLYDRDEIHRSRSS